MTNIYAIAYAEDSWAHTTIYRPFLKTVNAIIQTNIWQGLPEMNYITWFWADERFVQSENGILVFNEVAYKNYLWCLEVDIDYDEWIKCDDLVL